jgi:thioredoxin reductase
MNPFYCQLTLLYCMSEESGNHDLFDIIIIGAGPTGLFATFYAGMRHMRTKLIETLLQPGGQVSVLYPEKFIYDTPGHLRIKATELVDNLREQAMRFEPTVIYGERVVNLEILPDNTIKLTSDNGNTHYSRTVVIAAGIGAFAAEKLDVPGEKEFEGRGVYYSVQNEADMRDKTVLIVGGGDTAVDWALHLEHFAKNVTLIHRRDAFRAHESSVSNLLTSTVSVKLFKVLNEIRGDEHGVTQAVIQDNRTQEQETLNVDTILILIGFKALVENMKDWGLTIENRAILVNHKMETNLKGVYAIGDIAQPTDVAKLNLIVTGWGQAAIAVNYAKNYIDSKASIFPGHSSDISAH